MGEYSVCVLIDASKSYTVEAETPEQAIEKAEELHWDAAVSLCHQCSREVELGDAVGAIAYLDDAEVLDTTYSAQRIAGLEAENAKLRAELGDGTTGNKYRAELYDEVWQKARDMGYSNVTMALNDLIAMREHMAKLRAELERRADGWKWVPVEPTHEMAMAIKAQMELSPVTWCRYLAAARAMLVAAQSAPKSDDPVKVQDGALTGEYHADVNQLMGVNQQLLEALEDCVQAMQMFRMNGQIVVNAKLAIAAARKGEGE